MRFWAVLGALALAACGTDDSAQITPASPDFSGAGGPAIGAAPGVGAPTNFSAADGGPVHGTFRVIDGEGEITIETVNEDGTLSIAYGDGSTETGRWEQRGPGTFCVTMDWSGAEQACFQERVNSKGDWLSYDPEGQTTSRIQRIAPTGQ